MVFQCLRGCFDISVHIAISCNLTSWTGSINAASGIRAEAVNDPANEKILEEIRRKINEGQIPGNRPARTGKTTSDMKLLDKPVAVRSSATAEDSAKASFAGVHESFLNITGHENIEQAIKGCYASLWTPRAVAYRRKMGLSDQEVARLLLLWNLYLRWQLEWLLAAIRVQAGATGSPSAPISVWESRWSAALLSRMSIC